MSATQWEQYLEAYDLFVRYYSFFQLYDGGLFVTIKLKSLVFFFSQMPAQWAYAVWGHIYEASLKWCKMCGILQILIMSYLLRDGQAELTWVENPVYSNFKVCWLRPSWGKPHDLSEH